MYLGEINHGQNSYPGEHSPVIGPEVFDAVQAKLAGQAAPSVYRRSASDALLTRKLFDHLGRPMTPGHAVKGGVRYRYYISRREPGLAASHAAAIVRLPAPDLEGAVLKALAGVENGNTISGTFDAGNAGFLAIDLQARHTSVVRDLVERVDIRRDTIEIQLLSNTPKSDLLETIVAHWSKPPTRMQRDVIAPAEAQWADPRAMSSDTRSRLLSAIAVSHQWLNDLVAGRVESIDALAAREGRSSRSVSMLLSLAFLAPMLVKAIVDHQMPRGIGLARLVELPSEWSRQGRILGLPA